MKELQKIMGYVSYENLEYPFVFDKQEFYLTLIPPTREQCERNRYDWTPFQISEKEGWVGNCELEGFTREGYNIIFNVMDQRFTQNGFYVFSVNWAAYSFCDYSLYSIDGYKITGGDIDLFYPPKQVLEYKIQHNDQNNIEEIAVTAKAQDYRPCGEFILNGVSNNIEVSAFGYFSRKDAVEPLNSKSSMKVSFSQASKCEYVFQSLRYIGLFFVYATYRKNIDIHDVELFWTNDEGKIAPNGRLLYNKELPYEHDSKKYKRIIQYNIIKDKVGSLTQLFVDNDLTIRWIKESIDYQSKYTLPSNIMLFSSFEREFRLIYGKDLQPSETYLEMKDLVISKLDELIETQTGNKKRTLKSIRDLIMKIGNSYADMVYYALQDCGEIMKPFLNQKYMNINDKELRLISSRINDFRNEIAHCKLDLEYTPEHLSDLKIMESLMYAMRLKALGIETISIQKAINQLLSYNLAI